MRLRFLWVFWVLAAAALSVMPASGYADGEADAQNVQAAPSTGVPMGWIIGSHTLANLLAQDSECVVARALNQPTSYAVVTRGSAEPADWTVTRTQTFTDADALVDAVNAGSLLSGVGAVPARHRELAIHAGGAAVGSGLRIRKSRGGFVGSC